MVDIWDTSGSGFFSPPFVPIQAVVIYATFGLTTSCEQRGIFIVKASLRIVLKNPFEL